MYVSVHISSFAWIILLRCLFYMYSHLQAFITWGSAHSDIFNVSNGVRQGSVLSPILFGYYMEELIEIIVKRNIGCIIGDLFTGILVYADDIVLLAPRRHALQLMVHTCSSYANEITQMIRRRLSTSWAPGHPLSTGHPKPCYVA